MCGVGADQRRIYAQHSLRTLGIGALNSRALDDVPMNWYANPPRDAYHHNLLWLLEVTGEYHMENRIEAGWMSYAA